MSSSLIIQELIDPSIALLTLNRPEKRNALHIPLLEALVAELKNIPSNQRVVILKGAGPVFCAGLDLAEAGFHEKEEVSAFLLGELFSTICQMPSLTIAAVHGAAFGGGCGLACAFDYVIAAQGTLFGFPEVRRGLVPALVAGVLRQQITQRQMKQLFLFGENVTAEEALHMGFINRIVPKEDLLKASINRAFLGLKGAPQAVSQTKMLLESLSTRGIEKDLDIAMKVHHRARNSEEAKEGILSFLEKRNPSWDCSSN